MIDSLAVVELIDSLSSVQDTFRAIQGMDVQYPEEFVLKTIIEGLRARWIELVIAAGAIVTALMAILSYNRERHSRRAHILPDEHPGYFVIRTTPSSIVKQENQDQRSGLRIKLKNYGFYPAYKLEAVIKTFNKSGEGIFTVPFYAFNPVAKEVPWNIYMSSNVFEGTDIGIMANFLVDYIKLEIKYYDKILDETWPGYFYWRVGKNDCFVEPSAKEYNLIKKNEDTNNWLVEIPPSEIKYPIENE